jgi:hypothetical protein
MHGRERFWAFGGVRFKEHEKLEMKGTNCFIVKPNHQERCEVIMTYQKKRKSIIDTSQSSS